MTSPTRVFSGHGDTRAREIVTQGCGCARPGGRARAGSAPTSASGPTSATRRPRWRRASTPWPRCPGCGSSSVSRLYATTPVGVADQPEFRNAVVALDVPAGPDPETGALALLVALKMVGACLRTPGPRALGSPRARPRPARLRPPRDPRRAPARRPAATTRRSPGPSGSRSPTRAPGSASSSSRRWPTSPPASVRPAGARPSRRRGPARSGRGAGCRSPDRAWDRASGTWAELPPGQPAR